MRVKSDAPNGPWWLNGEVLCRHCVQLQCGESGYHCDGCGVYICEHCVIITMTTDIPVCPACALEEEEKEEASS
jgi:hypothetical protein